MSPLLSISFQIGHVQEHWLKLLKHCMRWIHCTLTWLASCLELATGVGSSRPLVLASLYISVFDNDIHYKLFWMNSTMID
jgi:hypothetical protein